VERDGSRRMQAPGRTGAQYYDAKWVKKAITRLVLVETLGGIAPPTKQFLHVFAKEAAGTNTDRTVYGAASASASFVVHHTQQISKHQGGGGGRRREHQQAGAQYAYQLAQLPCALSVPTGSTTSRTSKRQDVLLPSAPVGGAHAA